MTMVVSGSIQDERCDDIVPVKAKVETFPPNKPGQSGIKCQDQNGALLLLNFRRSLAR